MESKREADRKTERQKDIDMKTDRCSQKDRETDIEIERGGLNNRETKRQRNRKTEICDR
jgi:hypothetical protein